MEGFSGDVRACPALRPHPPAACTAVLNHPSNLFPQGRGGHCCTPGWLRGQLQEGPHPTGNLVLQLSLLDLAMKPPSSRVSGHRQESSPEIRKGGGWGGGGVRNPTEWMRRERVIWFVTLTFCT